MHVIVDSGPAEWWQILAALGPLAVLVAALIAWLTLRQRSKSDTLALQQKTDADSRAEWWRRTQWALDHALSRDQDTKALGLAALAVLTRSELARTEELELMDIAWQSVNGETGDGDEEDLDSDPDAVDAGDGMGDNGLTVETNEEGRP